LAQLKRALWLYGNEVRVIEEENWSWMLFQSADSYILSVICGGVAMFQLEVELLEIECLEFKKCRRSYIESLAAKIRNNPRPYLSRHMKKFSQDRSVVEAVKQWRVSNS
jgi:hypothetical protein